MIDNGNGWVWNHDGISENFATKEECMVAIEAAEKAKRIENFKKHWFKFSLLYVFTFIVLFAVQVFLVPAHIAYCLAKDLMFTVKNLPDPDELLRNISNHGNL